MLACGMFVVLASSQGCRSAKQYGENLDAEEIDGTYNTDTHPYYQYKPKPARVYTAIYTTRTNYYLVGNDCMRQFTRQMGFEYVAYDEYDHENLGPLAYHFYNVTSRLGMIFKAGPFWKIKVNRKLAECRRSSGDFIGQVPFAPLNLSIPETSAGTVTCDYEACP